MMLDGVKPLISDENDFSNVSDKENLKKNNCHYKLNTTNSDIDGKEEE